MREEKTETEEKRQAKKAHRPHAQGTRAEASEKRERRLRRWEGKGILATEFREIVMGHMKIIAVIGQSS